MEVNPQVDAASRDEWDRLRFGQLMDTCRSLTGSFTSTVLGLILGLVTILGFAVDRESWGLAATALIFEAMILVAMVRFRRAVVPLLEVAEKLEKRHCQEDSSVTEAHRGLMAQELRQGSLERVVIVVILIHIVITAVLAWGFGWSFAGA
jgi:hypothetical protein